MCFFITLQFLLGSRTLAADCRPPAFPKADEGSVNLRGGAHLSHVGRLFTDTYGYAGFFCGFSNRAVLENTTKGMFKLIYTDLTKKAMKIMFAAHQFQVDQGGLPYVFHPFHLAEQMDDEYSVCTALLHDVIEDSTVTLEQLEKCGFPDDVVDAIDLLTYDKKRPYMDYIEMIKRNELARKVKIADLKHNSDMSRLDKFHEGVFERMAKYNEALKYLVDEDLD